MTLLSSDSNAINHERVLLDQDASDKIQSHLIGALSLLSIRNFLVFGVNVPTRKISVYSHDDSCGHAKLMLLQNMDCHEALTVLAAKYALPEDRGWVMEILDMDNVVARLRRESSFKIHLRLNFNGLHYYCMTIAREGEAESFKGFLAAVALEDAKVNNHRIYKNKIETTLSQLEQNAPAYFYFDLTDNKLLRKGGASRFLEDLPLGSTVDEIVDYIARLSVKKEEARWYRATFSLDAMRKAAEKGQYEVVGESLCDYDDGVARWSRHSLRFLQNPANGHTEAIFFGADLSNCVRESATRDGIIQTLAEKYLDVLLVDITAAEAILVKSKRIVPANLVPNDQGSFPYEALIENYIANNVYSEDRDRMREALSLGTVSGALSHELEYSGGYRVVCDDEIRHFQFRFLRNRLYGFVILGVADVDEIVSVELQHQRELRFALDKAERANLEKSRFLSRMSHDMRTPLNGILGLLELADRHADDLESLAENRNKTRLAANNLVSLVNDVLDVAKIEQGELVLAREPFDLIKQGSDDEALLAVQAKEAHVELRLEIEPVEERLRYVFGSPLHLQRALTNIYSNCIKYNREGGMVSTLLHVVDSDETHVTYQWVIRDTGIGMSEEFLPHIFEPFSQGWYGSHAEHLGTGLGMGIVKGIAEKMGGTIEVDSQLGVGSTFVLTIPFELASKDDLEVAREPKKASVKGVRVLIVEDNELNREITQTLLVEEGAEVTCSVNGKEAVDLVLKRGQDAFDIILMDVMMPVMGGYEAASTLRSMGITLPIVAMTANAFVEDVRRAEASGMDDHLAKPLDVPKLLETVSFYGKKRRPLKRTSA